MSVAWARQAVLTTSIMWLTLNVITFRFLIKDWSLLVKVMILASKLHVILSFNHWADMSEVCTTLPNAPQADGGVTRCPCWCECSLSCIVYAFVVLSKCASNWAMALLTDFGQQWWVWMPWHLCRFASVHSTEKAATWFLLGSVVRIDNVHP